LKEVIVAEAAGFAHRSRDEARRALKQLEIAVHESEKTVHDPEISNSAEAKNVHDRSKSVSCALTY
jgi:hypothetical protein